MDRVHPRDARIRVKEELKDLVDEDYYVEYLDEIDERQQKEIKRKKLRAKIMSTPREQRIMEKMGEQMRNEVSDLRLQQRAYDIFAAEKRDELEQEFYDVSRDRAMKEVMEEEMISLSRDDLVEITKRELLLTDKFKGLAKALAESSKTGKKLSRHFTNKYNKELTNAAEKIAEKRILKRFDPDYKF